MTTNPTVVKSISFEGEPMQRVSRNQTNANQRRWFIVERRGESSREVVVFSPTSSTSPNTAADREKFERLKGEWLRELAFVRSMKQAVTLMPYLKIIGMGERALPFILQELKGSPHWWFVALQAITEANPDPSDDLSISGDLGGLARAWSRWADGNITKG